MIIGPRQGETVTDPKLLLKSDSGFWSTHAAHGAFQLSSYGEISDGNWRHVNAITIKRGYVPRFREQGSQSKVFREKKRCSSNPLL